MQINLSDKDVELMAKVIDDYLIKSLGEYLDESTSQERRGEIKNEYTDICRMVIVSGLPLPGVVML